jgi:hypothetical protein
MNQKTRNYKSTQTKNPQDTKAQTKKTFSMNHKENTIKKKITNHNLQEPLNEVPKHPSSKTPTQKRPKILSTQKSQKSQNTNQIKTKKAQKYKKNHTKKTKKQK